MLMIAHLYEENVAYSLAPEDLVSREYDLLAIITWNLCGKYSLLTAMLINPVITIFCIEFYGDYNLKRSKIGRWLTFPSQQ